MVVHISLFFCRQYNLRVPDPWHRKRTRYLSKFNTQKASKKASQPTVPIVSAANDVVQDESTPSSPVMIVSPKPERYIDTMNSSYDENQSTNGYNNNDLMSPQSVMTARSVNSSDRNSFNFQRQNRYIQDLLSSPRVDGMTFCLIMLDKCYYELQQR